MVCQDEIIWRGQFGAAVWAQLFRRVDYQTPENSYTRKHRRTNALLQNGLLKTLILFGLLDD